MAHARRSRRVMPSSAQIANSRFRRVKMNQARRMGRGWWMIMALAALSVSCASMVLDDPAQRGLKEQETAEIQQGLSVAGMARYCSRTYPTHGWTFYFGVADPCTAGGAGGTIQRA